MVTVGVRPEKSNNVKGIGLASFRAISETLSRKTLTEYFHHELTYLRVTANPLPSVPSSSSDRSGDFNGTSS